MRVRRMTIGSAGRATAQAGGTAARADVNRDRDDPDGPLALTIGNFDGVHRAHLAMLERTVEAATDLGLSPAVLTFHPSPKEFFARAAGAPIAPSLSTPADKLSRIFDAGIRQVTIMEFDQALSQLTPEAFIATVLETHLHVRWLLVGDDFRFGHKRAGTIATLRGATTFTVEQMHTVMVDGVHRVSSTGVRKALADGNLDVAARLLGRPYSICGRVTHGAKLGRKLGFPTANLPLRFVPPLSGICVVKIDGPGPQPRYGVASLGLRPTVNALSQPMLEVFIFDFNEPIYGRRIRVSFLAKLRDEKKYPDLESLKAQIRRDSDEARAYVESLGLEKAA
jgi:riboflavin kinase/FMN adenylyltransferase